MQDTNEYTASILTAIAPIRKALIDQLIADKGDESSDYLRGQLKGLERASSIIEEAATRFVTVDDPEGTPRLAQIPTRFGRRA